MEIKIIDQDGEALQYIEAPEFPDGHMLSAAILVIKAKVNDLYPDNTVDDIVYSIYDGHAIWKVWIL